MRLIAVGIAAVVLGSVLTSMSSRPVHALAAYGMASVARAADTIDRSQTVRCCKWGPNGWFDTWRNCHYCGLTYHQCRRYRGSWR
jgi:hypothetical protein